MKITLHLGVHRTGTTSCQSYLRARRGDLEDLRVAYWGPGTTRSGLLDGIVPGGVRLLDRSAAAERAQGRLQLRLRKLANDGFQQLLVSDENLIGGMRQNLALQSLYPAIGERMVRYGTAFGDGVDRVVLTIRNPARYWASVLAFKVRQGHPIPDDAALAAVAASPRMWRDVITDLACALPETEIWVAPFEVSCGNPVSVVQFGAGIAVPHMGAEEWLNRAPDLNGLRAALVERGEDPGNLPRGHGPWQPFSDLQVAEMTEAYMDDLLWLAQGAGGLANLTEDIFAAERSHKARHAAHLRGHDHDQEGQLEIAG